MSFLDIQLQGKKFGLQTFLYKKASLLAISISLNSKGLYIFISLILLLNFSLHTLHDQTIEFGSIISLQLLQNNLLFLIYNNLWHILQCICSFINKFSLLQ